MLLLVLKISVKPQAVRIRLQRRLMNDLIRRVINVFLLVGIKPVTNQKHAAHIKIIRPQRAVHGLRPPKRAVRQPILLLHYPVRNARHHQLFRCRHGIGMPHHAFQQFISHRPATVQISQAHQILDGRGTKKSRQIAGIRHAPFQTGQPFVIPGANFIMLHHKLFDFLVARHLHRTHCPVQGHPPGITPCNALRRLRRLRLRHRLNRAVIPIRQRMQLMPRHPRDHIANLRIGDAARRVRVRRPQGRGAGCE